MKKKIIYSLLVVIGLFMITGCKNSQDEYDVLKGKWKAIPENQNIFEYLGEIVGGREDYFLECDGNGYYDLKTKTEDLANASYTISDNNVVTFYDEGKEILGICKINDNELDCSKKSYYAFKYVKMEK